jgi:hypothetical protein
MSIPSRKSPDEPDHAYPLLSIVTDFDCERGRIWSRTAGARRELEDKHRLNRNGELNEMCLCDFIS